jgi:hypothetical protein
MAKARRKRAAVVVQGGPASSFQSLDDNALVQVLLAARAAGELARWASLSKHLCSLARSRLPVELWISTQQQAGLVIRSRAYGRPPFSGCTRLYLAADGLGMCCLAGGVLDAAQQWPALEELQLEIHSDFSQQQQQDDEEEETDEEDGHAAMEHFAATLLMHVPPMQQLRRLTLYIPALGACSAHVVLQLTQLTSLRLEASTTPQPPPAAAAAAADLCAMSRLTHLEELHLHWALAPHLPAGPEGPFCFPSSLVVLELSSSGHATPQPMAAWLAHLPGCPQLQSLKLEYGPQQHASAHPSHVARLLARHHTQLRTLAVMAHYVPEWGAAVAGLADVEAPMGGDWRPDASLAALKSLQSLHGSFLCVDCEADWQHLAQLTALTRLCGALFRYAPPLQDGTPLRLLHLECGRACLGGRAVGCLLMACTMLERAALTICGILPAQAPAGAAALPSHPTLRNLDLKQCYVWGDAAAAVAEFAALAPALRGLQNLDLSQWPAPSVGGSPALPDLSPCTALASLVFRCAASLEGPAAPHQVDFLSMVTPLVQLQRLEVHETPWVNPQVVLMLQHMLPQLRWILMVSCGWVSSVGPGGPGQQQPQQQQQEEEAAGLVEEREVLLKLKRLLRPGLDLVVIGSAGWLCA